MRAEICDNEGWPRMTGMVTRDWQPRTKDHSNEGAAAMKADRTSEPPLLGKHLTRAFGEGEMRTTALNDVSIELERGHVALLMGPSGSGKSTLLAVLSGLLQPDSGQVLALGQDLWKMSETQRERFRLKHCGF